MTDIDLGIDELTDFRIIGRGGFSTIYSALDPGFNRRVAVKLLHALDDDGLRRFDRERGIMGQLSVHPNVIMPLRAGYTRMGSPYLVMELVEGGSLQELIDRNGSVPWAEAVELILPVVAALGHAHGEGILHRDIKPANILLAGRTPKLTDFGIAAIRESTATQVAYTLTHCPPEAFATGADIRDERSDLYSIGSTLFALITGKPPYFVEGNDNPHAYMLRIVDQPVPVIPDELAPVPVREVVWQTLAKNPAERPQTAQALAERLVAAQMAADTRPPFTGTDPLAAVVNPVGPPVADVDTVVGRSGPGAGSGWGGGSTDPVATVPSAGTTPGPVDTFEPPNRPRRPWRGLLIGAAASTVLAVAVVAGLVWWLTSAGDDPASGDPELAWEFDVASSLASPPVVADGALVIGAHVTNLVHAIETDSGEERWRVETGGPVDAMPFVDDGTVYIGSFDGSMYAIDLATGDVRWREELAGEDGDDPAGIVAGAAVVDDVVVVGGGDGTIWGLDPDDGGELWSFEPDGDLTFNSAVVEVERDGRALAAIGGTDGGLYLVDPESGELEERIGLAAGVWFSRPLVVERPGGDGQQLWIGSSELERGFVNLVDIEDGSVLIFETPHGVGTAPALTEDGLIVVGTDGGQLFAVDQGSMGEVWRGTYVTDSQIKGSPVVDDGLVYIGTHGREVLAVDATDGEVEWRFEGEQIFGLSGPVIADDRLFVGNDSGAIYAFDLG